jgi:hypothetical protein
MFRRILIRPDQSLFQSLSAEALAVFAMRITAYELQESGIRSESIVPNGYFTRIRSVRFPLNSLTHLVVETGTGGVTRSINYFRDVSFAASFPVPL